MRDEDARGAPKTKTSPSTSRVKPARRVPLFPFLPSWLVGWFDGPEPVLRLEIIRIFAPLATLGFMSSRLAYADEWLSDVGFQVPAMPVPDYRQPFYLNPLSSGSAWTVAAVMVVSGLAVSVGFRARVSALIFALTLIYVALADRLSAFTVSKLSPAVMLALAASPCGHRWSVDAWLEAREHPDAARVRYVAAGGPRFFQVLLPVFYAGSAAAKIHGDWLTSWTVLYTHLHDSYQTAFSWFVLKVTPAWGYGLLQLVVITLEAGAPLWFAWKKTRPFALATAVAMHALIGMMFWPVRWFGLLMMTLWCGAYLPEAWLERWLDRASSLVRPRSMPPSSSVRAPTIEAKPARRKKRRAADT